MLKSFASFVVLAATLTPCAIAGSPENITVTVEYEPELLSTNAGAKLVLASIKAQAKDACSVTSSMSIAPVTDPHCAKSIAEKATTAILAKRDAAGLKTAPAFAQRASFKVASLNQR